MNKSKRGLGRKASEPGHPEPGECWEELAAVAVATVGELQFYDKRKF